MVKKREWVADPDVVKFELHQAGSGLKIFVVQSIANVHVRDIKK
jgi:hypothetical protein